MWTRRPILNGYRDDVPIWRLTPGPLILSLILFLCACGTIAAIAGRRLTVTVNNLSDVPLRSVTVHVSGAQYSLESIGPGEGGHDGDCARWRIACRNRISGFQFQPASVHLRLLT